MRFDVLADGEFPPHGVRVEYAADPRPTSPALEAIIAEEWDRRTAEARREGRVLFSGALLRYVRHRATPEADRAALELTVGPTCYRDFVGTNLFNHHRLDEFGWERFANPVGTTATLITREGRIVYGRRSDRVAYHAGHVHTFGGALEAQDRQPDGRIDAFASVLRELEEEVGVGIGDLEGLVCVGLARDRQIVQPELLFESRVRLSFEALHERWRTAASRNEHVELVWLRDEPDAVAPFIASCGPIAPVAVAALCLHGRRRWGEAWYRAMCAEQD